MSRPTTWLVEYLPAALDDMKALSSNRKEQIGVFNVVDKLMALGPQLVPPHMKPLRDSRLLELRPRQGRSPVRPLYIRVADSFMIVAVACTKDEFAAKLAEGERRAAQYLSDSIR
jgi:hypothetical protein